MDCSVSGLTFVTLKPSAGLARATALARHVTPRDYSAFHIAEASTLLMRFRPSSTLSANLIGSGSVERFSVVHSQKDAISAALSVESFESVKPDSMMGIRPAAALRRLSSGVAGGICFDISYF